MNINKKVRETRRFLQLKGYQTDNLWHIDDVKSKFECGDKQALEVLHDALTNEATMEQIWFAIDFHAREKNLTPRVESCVNHIPKFSLNQPEVWYEVAVCYTNDEGTETIERLKSLTDAIDYAKGCIATSVDDVEFIFVDRWYYEDDVVKKDDEFKTIIINK